MAFFTLKQICKCAKETGLLCNKVVYHGEPCVPFHKDHDTMWTMGIMCTMNTMYMMGTMSLCLTCLPSTVNTARAMRTMYTMCTNCPYMYHEPGLGVVGWLPEQHGGVPCVQPGNGVISFYCLKHHTEWDWSHLWCIKIWFNCRYNCTMWI